MRTKGLTKTEKEAVARDIIENFTQEELLEFKNFQEFWDVIDAQNAFKSDWQDFKMRGAKATYQACYYLLKRSYS